MSYKVLGNGLSDGNVDRMDIHESDTYEEAKSDGSSGYVRHDKQSGYDHINVVAANGYRSRVHHDYGWTHY
jgi:hypothetical protein